MDAFRPDAVGICRSAVSRTNLERICSLREDSVKRKTTADLPPLLQDFFISVNRIAGACCKRSYMCLCLLLFITVEITCCCPHNGSPLFVILE
jgi:hypothetical protein